MASKNDVYKVKSVATKELIKKYEEAGYYFRFQDKKQRLTWRSKSWGMIYSSAREAERDGSTVLNGKSCVSKAKDLVRWCCEFDSKFHVVIVFKGTWMEYGHDGEDVARYEGLVDVFDLDQFCEVAFESEEE